MVMGPTHSMSGAALGLAMAAVIPASVGGPSTAVGALTFAAVTAGAALLPDLDSPRATISRTFGFLSVGVAHLTENAALAVYRMTRSERDRPLRNGHRTATHTVWFALVTGLLVGALVTLFGQVAALIVLFLMLGLAVRGLFPGWSSRSDSLTILFLSAGTAAAVGTWQPQMADGWVLGTAVAVGIVAHLLGDALTKSGVPMFGGLVSINGKRWWLVRPPGILRIRSNGFADKVLLVGFSAVNVWLVYAALFDPAALGDPWPPVIG